MTDHTADIAAILSHRYDNGADYWCTADKKLSKGAPFSTMESLLYLADLGLSPAEPVLQESAQLIFSVWRPDGRFKLSPSGAIYPCQTALAAKVLCRLGYATDSRLQQTLQYFQETQQPDGGWQCNKYSFGRGPETNYSTPHTTLVVLDCFRYDSAAKNSPQAAQAVAFLLQHWELRQPISPCHYGIGTLFMQVEYPFRSYNLFYYLYVLSFYKTATKDPRFLEALAVLTSKTQQQQIVVERVVPKLAKLNFCHKGQVSIPATKRYQELLANLQV